jgi:hypothetical protein
MSNKPHALPTVAGEAMKQGAELANKAKIAVSKMRKADPNNIALADIEIQLTDALRWLEKAGAQTKPEEQ